MSARRTASGGCFASLGLAFATTVLGVLLAFYAGEVGSRAARVSDFEGGRGYLVVFLLAPLGGLFGLLVALAATRLGPWRGTAAWFVRLAAAVSVTALGILAVTALVVLTAERPPLLDGEQLDLEVEVKLAAGAPPPETRDDLTVAFQSSGSDNRYLELDYQSVRVEDQRPVVTGRTRLLTQPARSWVVVDAGELSQVVDLSLPPAPGTEQRSWSAWTRATRDFGGSQVTGDRVHEVRFRVLARLD